METRREVDDASQPAGDAEIYSSVSPGSCVQPINPQGAKPFERAPVGPSPRKPAAKRTTRSSPAKLGKQPSPKHHRQVSANPPFLPSLASARRSLLPRPLPLRRCSLSFAFFLSLLIAQGVDEDSALALVTGPATATTMTIDPPAVTTAAAPAAGGKKIVTLVSYV